MSLNALVVGAVIEAPEPYVTKNGANAVKCAIEVELSNGGTALVRLMALGGAAGELFSREIGEIIAASGPALLTVEGDQPVLRVLARRVLVVPPPKELRDRAMQGVA
jgi:hypothetical protein